MENLVQEFQLELFKTDKSNEKANLTSTFADNMKLPKTKKIKNTVTHFYF